MSEIIKNRSEILFLYDAKLCNPNGDPMDGNRPRLDEQQHCLVTDVRLKRTVRDYLFEKGYDGTSTQGDIFIRTDIVVTGEGRSKSYKDKDDFIRQYIDARMFGAVSAPKDKKKVFHLTGAVQFGMGRSLHPVRENFIKGTGGFSTKEDSAQRTFREEYNIGYGLIGFHGVINEQAAKHTLLTDSDVAMLMKGLWDGTKNLLTRSKKGHMPRLLLKIDYKDGFFIGDLPELVRPVPKDTHQTELYFTDLTDYTLDVSALNAALEQHQDKIISVSCQQDERLELSAPIFQKG
ncbi:MAG: type I-B CRISPR-associated protein Cas7/Csh2 [Bernardetiaceae bacterium]